ncbi:MAG TPA: PDZ domain-containing protein [Gemmatimonadaceae bacterium]|jgi:hypothetical protein
MTTPMRVGRTMIRGTSLAGVVIVIATLGVPSLLPAQDTPAPTPPAKTCPDCDAASEARIERELDAAREQVERARQALMDALQRTTTAQDTTGLNTEALARAQGELRRATERYATITSELLQRRIERANVGGVEALRALRDAQDVGDGGWLGVTLSGNRAMERTGRKMLMRFDDYPTIESVDPDSPAERAGIQAGDKLMALNGQDVTTGCEPFTSLLKPGSHLSLRVKRGPSTKQLTALIAKRPQSEWTWSFRVAPRAPMPSAMPSAPSAPAPPAPPSSDVQVFVNPLPPMAPLPEESMRGVISLNGELAVVAGAQVRPVGNLGQYFGVHEGVLVLHVVPGSVAGRSGLRDGDVILSADRQSITTPGALSRSIYRASDAQRLTLDIVRLKKRRTVLLRWDSR